MENRQWKGGALMISNWLRDRDYRDAIMMIYRSDPATLAWLQQQADHRRALLREVTSRG